MMRIVLTTSFTLKLNNIHSFGIVCMEMCIILFGSSDGKRGKLAFGYTSSLSIVLLHGANPYVL